MRKNKNDIAGKEIVRLWGDVPVMDAKKDLRVFIKPCDLEGATRKDPAHCVFARACKRTFDARKILFYRQVAYVELPGEDGQRRVERFIMSESMTALVKDFDEGRTTIPEAGFLLSAPTPSQTLNAKARRWRNRGKNYTQKTREKLEGTRLPDENDSQRYDKGIVIDLEARSGTGAVHFAKTSSATEKKGKDTKNKGQSHNRKDK